MRNLATGVFLVLWLVAGWAIVGWLALFVAAAQDRLVVLSGGAVVLIGGFAVTLVSLFVCYILGEALRKEGPE